MSADVLANRWRPTAREYCKAGRRRDVKLVASSRSKTTWQNLEPEWPAKVDERLHKLGSSRLFFESLVNSLTDKMDGR